VNALDVAQAFLGLCRRDAPTGDLVFTFRRALHSLGFRYFACWSHVDPLHPPADAVVLHDYPAEWIRRYSDEHLHAVDPVSQWAARTLVPFHWDDDRFRATLTRQQELLLSRCATNGIADGFTVPLHAPQADATHAASCTVIPDAPTLPVEHFAAVQWMAPALFEAARSERARLNVVQHERSLSDRERECLLFAARGKSDWVVGRILGISERTVHNHIENAKRRLRVTTRVQAIVQALATRQIALEELVQRRGTTVTTNPELIGSVRSKGEPREATHLARERRG
jgi:LuxR family quorum-sensing system transcriptional regulator CciR